MTNADMSYRPAVPWRPTALAPLLQVWSFKADAEPLRTK